MKASQRDFQILLVYNLETELIHGAAQDLIALQDTVNTVQHIAKTLQQLGYTTELLAARNSLKEFEAELRRYKPKNTFVFYNCDGFNGETWAAVYLAEIIERLGFAHTGAPATAIANVTDKALAKSCLRRAKIPTPDSEVHTQPSEKTALRFPLIVKLLREDASLGIDLESVVTDSAHLQARVGYLLDTYDQPALVEEFISGRELAVSLWGNGELEVLPLYEEDYSHITDPLQHLLTYGAKWLPDSPFAREISENCPADLPETDAHAVRQVALGAYRALGLRDFGRLDIRLRDGIPYVIDINDLPDLAPESGFARTAQVAGYIYPQMIERILHLALKREGWC